MDRRYSIGGGGKPSYSKSFDDFSCRNFINFCRTNFKKTLAFTLAETLIVMGIIGVVAALTLPNLNSSTGDREKVAKVKKIYSNLQDAYGRATAVYGPIDEWPTEGTLGNTCIKQKNLSERLTEFMKISKDYGNNKEYILADGTCIYIYIAYIAASQYYSGAKYVGIIDVDIDGKNKGKDAYGYDRFVFDITDQGIYPEGLADNDLTWII